MPEEGDLDTCLHDSQGDTLSPGAVLGPEQLGRRCLLHSALSHSRGMKVVS